MLTLKHLLDPKINYILIKDGNIHLYNNVQHLKLDYIYSHLWVLLKQDSRTPSYVVCKKSANFSTTFYIDKYPDLLNLINRGTIKFDWKKEGF